MEPVSEAITFAVKAHDGMQRKKGELPYILHPIEEKFGKCVREFVESDTSAWLEYKTLTELVF